MAVFFCLFVFYSSFLSFSHFFIFLATGGHHSHKVKGFESAQVSDVAQVCLCSMHGWFMCEKN